MRDQPGNSIFAACKTTIFEVMSRLAAEHGAINLGQGFPEALEPRDVLEKAAEAVLAGPHQYPSMMGIPALRQEVARHNKRFYDLDIDWQTEVMVTSGATEALADCLFGLIEPGDEVVVIEPLYDSYLPIIRRAGGIPKLVRLEPPSWELPRQALRDAFSDKTKLLILNSPMNPSGKVFSREELGFLADLLISHDAYAICDEVYEHLVFDGVAHIPLMTLPGMRERAVRIGSAGKTFSLTGWKVGYMTACPALLATIAKAHQYVTFTTPPALQSAVAYGLAKDESYFSGLSRDMQGRRDLLRAGLQSAGFDPLAVQGSYFMTVDIRSVGFNGTDEEFCRTMTTQAGVACVPVSAFYENGDVGTFARFCFAKSEDALTEASNRLRRYFGR